MCLVGESDLQLNPYLFIAYLLIDVIVYSNGIDNPIYKMETDDRHGEQTCRLPGRLWGREWDGRELGVGGYKTVTFECVGNGFLLYRTGKGV